MIDHSVAKMLLKVVPNYHLVSPSFARNTFSICVCKDCVHSIQGKRYGTPDKDGRPCIHCRPVFERLQEDDLPLNYALVAENGTCDRGEHPREDYTRYRLEEDEVKS